jgi:hypothetical protein
MYKKKIPSSLIVGGMALVGLVVGIATMAGAQSVTTPPVTPIASTVTTQQAVDTPEPGDVPDSPMTKHGHAPQGGDGVVSSIVMSEESNENGVSYTIDASNATVTNNGVAGTLSDVKVGAKIFVQGTTTGTNVVATSISIGHGHKGEGIEKANDTDGGAASEASEPAGSADKGE